MRAPCLRRGHLMVAAAEIAWEAFVLAISLFFLAGQFALAVAGKGERVLRSSVSLQGPKKLSLACRSSSWLLCHMSPSRTCAQRHRCVKPSPGLAWLPAEHPLRPYPHGHFAPQPNGIWGL